MAQTNIEGRCFFFFFSPPRLEPGTSAFGTHSWTGLAAAAPQNDGSCVRTETGLTRLVPAVPPGTPPPSVVGAMYLGSRCTRLKARQATEWRGKTNQTKHTNNAQAVVNNSIPTSPQEKKKNTQKTKTQSGQTPAQQGGPHTSHTTPHTVTHSHAPFSGRGNRLLHGLWSRAMHRRGFFL